jgi:hypothetical protein
MSNLVPDASCWKIVPKSVLTQASSGFSSPSLSATARISSTSKPVSVPSASSNSNGGYGMSEPTVRTPSSTRV